MADRYPTGVPIGRGGMSEVYRSWDPVLERYIAIKFLRRESPELAERVKREARAQARVDHPNVCKVYEVGEEDGRPFIAMQYIDGVDLYDAAKDLTVRQKVSLFRTIVSAVEAAHVVGLIHRDLKPGNVLVERDESGKLTPYVVDFGIAREESVEALTATGQVIGTVGYMSPEQAQGETHNLDRRSDVFSLGAVLYELLTDQPPFDGKNSYEILKRTLEGEPPLLRKVKSDLPEDLEIVVTKCLEKELDRRYQTARELEEDLQRWLEGEPITARMPTFGYRMSKRIRKQPLTSALAVAVLIAVTGLAAVYVRGRILISEQAKYAEQFGQRAERIESLMRYSYLQPLHNLSQVKKRVEDEIHAIEKEVESQGKAAHAPGHYAIGRGWFSLGEIGRARQHLEEASKEGFHSSSVALALGRTLGEEYSRATANLDRLSDPELYQEELLRVQQELAEPARKYLELINPEELGLLGYERTYLEGLLALYDGKADLARRYAQKALQEEPWFYDSMLLIGEAYLQTADLAIVRGATDEARFSLQRAREVLQHASERAPSDPRVYTALCRNSLRTMELESDVGEFADTLFQTAMRECGSALVADPNSVEALNLRTEASWKMAQAKIRKGEAPDELVAQAIQDANRSLAIAANRPAAFATLGAIHSVRAERASDLALDALPAFEESVKIYKEGLSKFPSDRILQLRLGQVLIAKGQYESFLGKDPMPSFEEAKLTLRQVPVRPVIASRLYANLCWVLTETGYYLYLKGQDPGTNLDEAIIACSQALEHRPDYIDAIHRLGYAHWSKAEYQASKGINPAGSFDAAATAFARVLAIDANRSGTHVNRSHVLEEQAKWVLRQGGDPEALLKESDRHLKAFREIYPGDHAIIKTKVEMVRADMFMARGESPEKALSAAMDWAQKLMEINPHRTVDIAVAVHAYSKQVSWLLQQKPLPLKELRKYIKEGMDRVNSGLKINPDHPDILAYGSVLQDAQGQLADNDQDRQKYFASARKSRERALTLRPDLVQELPPLTNS